MFCTLRACPQINERVAKEMAPESVSSDGDRKTFFGRTRPEAGNSDAEMLAPKRPFVHRLLALSTALSIGVPHAHLIDVLYLSLAKEIAHEANLDTHYRRFFRSFFRVFTVRPIPSAV